MLNSWAAKLLGNPKKVRCTVEMLDGAGAVLETRKVLLSDLTLAPLDVVFGVEPLAGAGQISSAFCIKPVLAATVSRNRHVCEFSMHDRPIWVHRN